MAAAQESAQKSRGDVNMAAGQKALKKYSFFAAKVSSLTEGRKR
jgi:hypothetical protein